MGRGRVEMRRIGNDVSRRAAFGKRRRGLLKKAHELAVLCGVDLGVLVFDAGAGAGKQFDYCSPNTSWSELIERYESITNHQIQFQGINHDDDDDDQQRREHDRLEASVRRQAGEDLPSAATTAAELDDLERRLECMLGKVREMKDKLLEQQLDEAHRKVHILEDQNSLLRSLNGEEGHQRAAVEASAVVPNLPATALRGSFPEVEEEELTALRMWPQQLPDVLGILLMPQTTTVVIKI